MTAKKVEWFNLSETKKNLVGHVLRELLVLLIFGLLASFLINEYLVPRADIQVTLEKSSRGLLLKFRNNASYAGEDFSLYASRAYFDGYFITAYSPENYLCDLNYIKSEGGDDDRIFGFQSHCEYIPPKSELVFQLGGLRDLDDISVNGVHYPKTFVVTYWSKNTKSTTIECVYETLSCSS